MGTKISALPAGTPAGADLVAIVQSGTTKKGTVAALRGGPLSAVLWLDKTTASASHDGSASAPFATAVAAFAALDALTTDKTLLVGPGDNTAEGALALAASSKGVHLLGLNRRQVLGATVGCPSFGDITMASSSGVLSLEAIEIFGLLSHATGTVQLVDARVTGTIAGKIFRGDRSNVVDTITLTGSGASQFSARECQFSKNGSVLSTDGTAASFIGCTFVATPTITFSGSAGVVTMDGRSYKSFVEAGGTVSNGSILVTSAPVMAPRSLSTTQTLVATDAHRGVDSTAGSGITLTISTAAGYSIGDEIPISQTGAGQVTVAGSGFTIVVPPGCLAKLRGAGCRGVARIETSSTVSLSGELDF